MNYVPSYVVTAGVAARTLQGSIIQIMPTSFRKWVTKRLHRTWGNQTWRCLVMSWNSSHYGPSVSSIKLLYNQSVLSHWITMTFSTWVERGTILEEGLALISWNMPSNVMCDMVDELYNHLRVSLVNKDVWWQASWTSIYASRVLATCWIMAPQLFTKHHCSITLLPLATPSR